MDPISIDDSVGEGGRNSDADASRVIAALMAIGPGRGGLSKWPDDWPELIRGIRTFQTRQMLPLADGRVDRVGNTIKRINALLLAGPQPGPIPPAPPPLPPPMPPPGVIGRISDIEDIGDLKETIHRMSASPVRASLESEKVFKWTAVEGKGTVRYLQLDERVVPRWFGVVIPAAEIDISRIHVSFHPTTNQAGYDDALYHKPGAFHGLFRYLGGDRNHLALQFCAADTKRIMIFPLMNESASSTAGVLPARWKDIFGRILGMIQSGLGDGESDPVEVTDMVVSSFSSGISYSHAFRTKGGLGDVLSGVIDFDGMFSTSRALSASIAAKKVMRMWQMPSIESSLPALASRGTYPMGLERWQDDAVKGMFVGTPYQQQMQLHPQIAMHTMYIAAQRLEE